MRARPVLGEGGRLLTAAEISNIGAFIATGRRAVLMGENNYWTAWNNQVLGIVGGTYGSQYTGVASAILSHELTAGVSAIYLPMCGRAVGGTALFDQNVASLWGAGANVLTMLNVNVFDDGNWGTEDNGQFGINVAAWAAGRPGDVPDASSTLLLMGLAVAGLDGIRRRIRSC